MILSQQVEIQSKLNEEGMWVDLPESIGGRIHILFDFDGSAAKLDHLTKQYRKKKNLPRNADVPKDDRERLGREAAFGKLIDGWEGQELSPGVPAEFNLKNFLLFMSMPVFERAFWAAIGEEEEARKKAEAEILGNSRGGAAGAQSGAASPKTSESTREA